MFIHLLSRQIILTHDMTELKGNWSHKYFPCAAWERRNDLNWLCIDRKNTNSILDKLGCMLSTRLVRINGKWELENVNLSILCEWSAQNVFGGRGIFIHATSLLQLIQIIAIFHIAWCINHYSCETFASNIEIMILAQCTSFFVSRNSIHLFWMNYPKNEVFDRMRQAYYHFYLAAYFWINQLWEL